MWFHFNSLIINKTPLPLPLSYIIGRVVILGKIIRSKQEKKNDPNSVL